MLAISLNSDQILCGPSLYVLTQNQFLIKCGAPIKKLEKFENRKRLFYLFFILLFSFIIVLQFELIKELPDLLTGKSP